ncbi:MAG: polyprenyl synthetase family protein [Proteobacteria bacterium]|nr:polyprenyl synthetase family protein [Pseudomonadota bacterium]MBU1715941.1 polyprenyl synthetase family protein [Pseudomonadota bacterium]
MDIKTYLNEKKQQVENGLEEFMFKAEGPLTEHIKALRYSLFAGGKRVRPILCIAAAETVDQHTDYNTIMPIAVALECIHTYSLIHDDLPAMDDDKLRRGKPTNHMVFGEAEAILAGDGLLTFAFELLTRHNTNQIDPTDRLRIIEIIAKAVGSLGMVGGQALDLASEGIDIDFEQLRLIHSCKTGALITASVQAGAIAGKATPEQFEAMTSYGQLIGLAFQIVDDLLNVEGTKEELGKAVGSDAERQKSTYPAFFGLEKTRTMARETVNLAVTALEDFNNQADSLRELALYIYNRTN